MNPIPLCQKCTINDGVYDEYNTELDINMYVCDGCSLLDEFKLISYENIQKKYGLDKEEMMSLDSALWKPKFKFKTHLFERIYYFKDVLKFVNNLKKNNNEQKLKLEKKIKKMDIVIDPVDYTPELKAYIKNGLGNLSKILKPYERKKQFTKKYGDEKYLEHKNDFVIKEWINFGVQSFDVIEKYFDRKETFILEVNSGKHKFNYNHIMNSETDVNPKQVFEYLLYDKPDLNSLLYLIDNAQFKNHKKQVFNNENNDHYVKEADIINDKSLMDQKYLRIQNNKKQLVLYKSDLRGMNVRRNNILKKLASVDGSIKKIEKSIKDLEDENLIVVLPKQ